MADRFWVEGIPDEGIRVCDIKDEVPESLICQYFGPKSSKSGWKYNARTTLEEQEAIYSLFRRVYETDEMSNKELTLQFARGLVYMSMGNKVDWCQFRDERRKYRVDLWKKKDINLKDKSATEVSACPTTIGKKRCTARVSEVETNFPCELKLSVKSECQVLGAAVMGKKVAGKGLSGTLNSAFWGKSDLEMMEKVIQKRSKLVRECEISLSKSTLQSADVEDKLRCAVLLRSDRLEMIQEAKFEYENIQSEELAVRAQIEERNLLLGHGQVTAATDQLLVNLLSDLEALEFRRVCAHTTRKRSDKVVSDCNESVAILESKLTVCRTTTEELFHRVSSLKGLLASMDKQLLEMEKGGGNLLFPRPLSNSPSVPFTLTHTLNACPVCSLWFSCWDYVPASCGHCYHPWCLGEHMKISCECLLSFCKKPFLDEHKIALGIRPTAAVVIEVASKEAEVKNIKNYAAKIGEYSDDSSLLPKNTSVIKQDPASCSNPVLRVEEQAKNHGSMAGANGKGPEITSQAAAPNMGMDSLDDVGVDIYAIPELVTNKIDLDKNTRIAAMLNTTATEWQRQTQEGFSGGRGSGRGGYGRGGAPRGSGSGGIGVVLKSALKTTTEQVIERNVLESQSSKSNLNAKKGLISTIKNPAKVQLCYQCHIKVPALRLQKCGHALFCFGCVNGKSECPFCFEKIVGWEPLSADTQSTKQTLLRAAALIPGMVCGNRKRKIEESNDPIKEVLPNVFVTPAEGFSDSDEEKESGLQFWCDDEVFSAGGFRSVDLKSKEEMVHQHVHVTAHKEVVGEFELNKETSEGPVVESASVRVFSRKKTESKSISSLNQTRVMEKALTELLGPSSTVGVVEKTLKKVQVEASTPTFSKGYKKLLGGSKKSTKLQKSRLLPKAASRIKSVPAKLKDL